VPFINLPGFKAGQLNLNGQILAKIYEGEITNWNDRAIATINAGRTLPDLPIHPIARRDGSGSTYIFSDYLSKVSPSWSEHFGTKLLIQWPSAVTQADGSDGVIAAVEKSPGTIGYVDFGYVIEHHLEYTKLQNHDGQFVAPTFDTFSAALTNSNWKTQAHFNEMLTDKPGPESWPITAGTFVLIQRISNDPDKTVATLQFFSWSFLHGDEIARKAGYVRLSDSLQAKIFVLFATITDKDGHKLSWSPF
jgi:phosphate transport system substrate-binding protein